MSSNAVFSGTLSFTPPGGGTQVMNVAVQAPYSAQVEATIDIPDMTTSATAFALSFGSIASATLLLVKNDNNQDMGVRLQAAVANEFQVPAGSALLIAMPAAPGSNPVTAAAVVTTATQSGPGSVSYAVFGT